MNPEHQDFTQLRRLLKLKRYEQPPPRYFNDFSAQVVLRLQTAQGSTRSSWWQRVWAGLELRPALPVALSAAVCGLLVFGAVYSETAEMPEGLVRKPSSPMNGKSQAPARSIAAILETARPVRLTVSSTNPVPADESLFDRIGSPEVLRTGHPLLR